MCLRGGEHANVHACASLCVYVYVCACTHAHTARSPLPQSSRACLQSMQAWRGGTRKRLCLLLISFACISQQVSAGQPCLYVRMLTDTDLHMCTL